MIKIRGQNRCFHERSLNVTPRIVNDVGQSAAGIKDIAGVSLETFERRSNRIVCLQKVLLQYGHIVDRRNPFDRISSSELQILTCIGLRCCRCGCLDWTGRRARLTVLRVNHHKLRVQKTTVPESRFQFVEHYHLAHHIEIGVELCDYCYPTVERKLGAVGVQTERAQFRRRQIVGVHIDRVHIGGQIVAQSIVGIRIQMSTGDRIDQQTERD